MNLYGVSRSGPRVENPAPPVGTISLPVTALIQYDRVQLEVPSNCEWFDHQLYVAGQYVRVSVHVQPHYHECPSPPIIEEKNKERETGMPEFVVEETTDTGHKVRTTISVSVTIGESATVLSEAELEDLAKAAAEKIGVKFIGKA